MGLGVPLGLDVELELVLAVGLEELHCPGGKQVGRVGVADDDVDLVGCVGWVGADDVGAELVVGADEELDLVACELGSGGGAVVAVVAGGRWSVCFGGTLAAGGNFSIGSPSRSAFITAAQVAVG